MKLRKQPAARLALELVADKWFVLIIHELKTGKKRYMELQRAIPGISQRMLTRTLRNMEIDGLLNRVAYPVVPPKTEYSLTPLGETLLDPLHALCGWAEVHFEEVRRNRSRRARKAG